MGGGHVEQCADEPALAEPACAGPDRPLQPWQGATVPLQMAYMVRLGSFGFGSLPDMLCRMNTCGYWLCCSPCVICIL